MPIIRTPLFDPSRPLVGLVVTGPEDSLQARPGQIPSNTFRRFKRVNSISKGEIRSAPGNLPDTGIGGAHSLTHYGGFNFQASGSTLYRAGSSILTGLNSTRLSFIQAPPSPGKGDYLFVSGGGLLRKVDSLGAVTSWGIDPPVGTIDGVAATTIKAIDPFSSAATWTGVNAVLSDETTIVAELSGNSMQMDVSEDARGTATKNITVDLSIFVTVTSPDEDWIRFWFRVNEPRNLDHVEIAFSLGDTTFAVNTYSRRIEVETTLQPPRQTQTQRTGVADVDDLQFNQERVVEETIVTTPSDRVRVQEIIGQTAIPDLQDTWVQIRVPKSSFKRSGNDVLSWADVQAVRLSVVANGNGAVETYFDTLELAGGYGLQGDYKYKVTFRNMVTGNRSNSTPEPAVTVANVERGTVTLTNIPVSLDTQVDQREIWRTLGNGTLYFRIGTIDDNVTTTFSDKVADFFGLDSSGANPIMQNLQLPLDNTKPLDSFGDAVIDTQSVVFWLDDSDNGRVYYSPPGRPESNKGFIEVSTTSDSLQRLVIWNGVRYAFSTSRLFRIDGNDPYTSREVFGVPGVSAANAFTVRTTPFGIIWQANDDVRVFDGVRSIPIGVERLGDMFRGGGTNPFGAFEGVTAAYGCCEYIISDGRQTLSYHVVDKVWRDVGGGYSALEYQPDADQFIGGNANGTEIVEAEGALSSGEFEVEFPAMALDTLEGAIVLRLLVRADTNAQLITPTWIIDNTEIAQPPFNDANRRTFEYAVGKTADLFGVRLTSALGNGIRIFSAEVDIYVPDK